MFGSLKGSKMSSGSSSTGAYGSVKTSHYPTASVKTATPYNQGRRSGGARFNTGNKAMNSAVAALNRMERQAGNTGVQGESGNASSNSVSVANGENGGGGGMNVRVTVDVNCKSDILEAKVCKIVREKFSSIANKPGTGN